MRLDYRNEIFSKVRVCGVECEFNNMRIERSSIPEGKYQYEIAGDDESGGDPVRVQPGKLVNFYGALICDRPLTLGEMVYYGWRTGILSGLKILVCLLVLKNLYKCRKKSILKELAFFLK